MALDLDLFDDILPEHAGRNARAGSKFQPKSKPQPRKDKHAPVPTNLTNAAKETPITTTTVNQDGSHPSSLTETPDVMSGTTTLKDPLPDILQNHELVASTEVVHPKFPLPDGDGNIATVGILSQQLNGTEFVDSTDALHSELTISNAHGDLQSGIAKPGRESADIFSGLDDIIYETTTANVSTVRKFQPRVKVNSQLENKLKTSRVVSDGAEGSIHVEGPIFHASNAKNIEGGPDQSSFTSFDCPNLKPCSFSSIDTSPGLVSQETANTRETRAFDYEEDSLINRERLEREEDAFPGLESLNVVSQTTTSGDAQSIPCGSGYVDDDLHPASADHDYFDFSIVNSPLPAVFDRPSESPMNEEERHRSDASGTIASIPQEAVESEAVPTVSRKQSIRSTKRKVSTVLEDSAIEDQSQGTLDERPSVASDEGKESGKSSKRPRKRSTAHVLADKTVGGTEENMRSNYSLVDEDANDDDEIWEDTSHRKRAAKNAKPAFQNQKSGGRRKKPSEAPDSLSKAPPKKKLSHSTRRNKRQVNKTLLETPDEEIDPRKLPLKDLIFLGELREQRRKKDAATSQKSLPNQSVNNYSVGDAPYDPDDPFASHPDLNPNDDEAPPKINYHSFMKRTSQKRWSKQDTELFYEAIRQFGTDFTMIGQLFPDLDRHSIKLKYKNEERRNPMKLNDALTNRSKDRSHFEQVIEKLQRQMEENSDGETESAGISGEAEDNSPEINEVAKSEENVEAPKNLETEEVPEHYDHAKSAHETQDDAYKWSPSDSDFGDYVAY